MNIKNTTYLLLLFLAYSLAAQNTRINDYNQIGWYNYFGTFKLNKNFSLHSEYQFRRENYLTDKQQNLLRVGLNYQLSKDVQLRFGYAWIETYPYGEIPINGFGKDFTEHRLFQAVTLNDKIFNIEFSHRLMLEQRFIGRYSTPISSTEDDYVFLNRFRYMLRAQLPLKGDQIKNQTPYIAAYNELFIGFGENVNENVFDQNRIGLLLGYRFNNNFRIEAGFLNQILQLGRELNQQNVFQNNNGFIINTYFNFDLSDN